MASGKTNAARAEKGGAADIARVPVPAQRAVGEADRASAQGTGKLRWASIGICCTLAWAFLINAASSATPGADVSWQASYLVLAAAMVLFGGIAHKVPAFLESAAAGYIAAGLGAAGSAVLVLSFSTPVLTFAQTPATILCSCVLGWLYLQWGRFYVQLNIRAAVAACSLPTSPARC